MDLMSQIQRGALRIPAVANCFPELLNRSGLVLLRKYKHAEVKAGSLEELKARFRAMARRLKDFSSLTKDQAAHYDTKVAEISAAIKSATVNGRSRTRLFCRPIGEIAGDATEGVATV